MTDKQPPQRKRAVQAGLWASLQNVAKEGIGFLVFLLLARFFLNDTDFGIVALANSFVMLGQTVGQFGLGTALIRQRDIMDRHKTACFWVSLGAGLLIAGGLSALADVFAVWADEPRVAPVLRVLSFGLILTSAGIVHAALLQRELGFKALAIRTLVASISGGIVGITIAILGGGVWSLIALNLVTAGVSTLLLWLSLSWRPKFELPLEELFELVPTGLRVMAIGLVRYVGNSADRFAVGFLIGLSDLGVLYVGQRIVQALQTVLTQSINSVALPVFSEIQDDPHRIRNVYLTAFRTCVVVIVPLFFGLALISNQVSQIVLGEKWSDLPIILSILAISAAFSSPLYFNQPLLIAIGKSQKALNIATIGTAVQIICVVIGAFFGVTGVAVGILVRQILMNIVWYIVLSGEINLSGPAVFKTIKGPVLSIIFMTIVVLSISHFLYLGQFFQTALLVGAGAFTYAATLWLLDRSAVRSTIQMFRRS